MVATITKTTDARLQVSPLIQSGGQVAVLKWTVGKPLFKIHQGDWHVTLDAHQLQQIIEAAPAMTIDLEGGTDQ